MTTVPTPPLASEAAEQARLARRTILTDLLEQAAPLATELELPRIASHLEVLADAVLAAIPGDPPVTVALTVGARVRLVHHPECHEVGTVARFGRSQGHDVAVVFWPAGTHPLTASVTAHCMHPLSDLVVIP